VEQQPHIHPTSKRHEVTFETQSRRESKAESPPLRESIQTSKPSFGKVEKR
jgi:hypothetical protein